MKIDVTQIAHGLITVRDDLLKQDLFWYLFKQVYGTRTSGYLLFDISQSPYIDLRVMARMLREQGWCAYYWRDRHGVDHVGDCHTFMNYGKREGLIIGRYCPNLTAWLLSHT